VDKAERVAALERQRRLAKRAYRAYRRAPYWAAARIALAAAAGAAGWLLVHWLI
jgi:hypothetical protein